MLWPARKHKCFERRIAKRGITKDDEFRIHTTRTHLDDIVELVAQSTMVEVVGFRSFYYQVELGANIRPFYGLWMNQPHQLFGLSRVLPLGGCHSVWVAKQLTLAQMRLLGIPSKSLVYIDNVYIPRDSPVPPSHNKPKEHCKFEIGELLFFDSANTWIICRLHQKTS